jgi:DNA-3-methyladenine glycosylase II
VQDIKSAISHLRLDPILNSLIDQFGVINYPAQTDIYSSLVYSIIEQQLSGKAAETIYNRFLNLFPNKQFTPGQILAFEPAQIRAVGTSWAKAASLQDLSRKVLDGTVNLAHLPDMSDEKVIKHLIQVKGIGLWSAQMRLMFSLSRPDVFPVDDVGIQNAFVKHYHLNRKHKNFKQKMLKLAAPWQPYRTVACWYLWASLDNRP